MGLCTQSFIIKFLFCWLTILETFVEFECQNVSNTNYNLQKVNLCIIIGHVQLLWFIGHCLIFLDPYVTINFTWWMSCLTISLEISKYRNLLTLGGFNTASALFKLILGIKKKTYLCPWLCSLLNLLISSTDINRCYKQNLSIVLT